jgi:hypothetical protein
MHIIVYLFEVGRRWQSWAPEILVNNNIQGRLANQAMVGVWVVVLEARHRRGAAFRWPGMREA